MYFSLSVAIPGLRGVQRDRKRAEGRRVNSEGGRVDLYAPQLSFLHPIEGGRPGDSGISELVAVESHRHRCGGGKRFLCPLSFRCIFKPGYYAVRDVELLRYRGEKIPRLCDSANLSAGFPISNRRFG